MPEEEKKLEHHHADHVEALYGVECKGPRDADWKIVALGSEEMFRSLIYPCMACAVINRNLFQKEADQRRWHIKTRVIEFKRGIEVFP